MINNYSIFSKCAFQLYSNRHNQIKNSYRNANLFKIINNNL